MILRSLILLTTALVAGLPALAAFPNVDLRPSNLAPNGNPIENFMFFVPLLSPDPVTTICTSNNTQRVYLTSAVQKNAEHSLDATYKFRFTGDGAYVSRFENDAYTKQIPSGTVLDYQLDNFEVAGSGEVLMDVVGTISNGVASVSEVRLHFDGSGRSLVTATIYSLRSQNGVLKREKDTVAEVNMLIFHRRPGRVRMDVAFGSIKPKDAGPGAWQDMVGKFKGKVANIVVRSLLVSPVGNEAILEMAEALAAGKSTFQFVPAPPTDKAQARRPAPNG